MEKILLLGGGGHCRSIIDTIQFNNKYEIYGIVDPNIKKDERIFGISVVGKDDDLENLFNEGITYAFISVGSIGNTKIRNILYEKAKKIGFKFPVIIDKSSIVSKDVIVGSGTFVGKGSIINSGSIIGENSIINSGSIIEHDCYIGKLVHISPGATLCGGVKVGNKSHIGSNATIIQGIGIGEEVIVGAGSVVIRNIDSFKKVVGNPAREV
ncbi:acetyltransferase [Clostridium sp. HBUAS56017]|uniref:acetyltransferase n=1 Tax=Clostridium sp. HBUAS56017 TaxID=2571128 RepID=UPI0011773F8A|nr:acetyltransferase [Clostridium sp. HBUAS56017]